MTNSGDNSLKGVVFDLDGVIFDSIEANVAFYDHILQVMGHPANSRDIVDIIHREPTEVCLKALLGQGPAYAQAMDYWRVMDTRPFVGLLSLYPGVEATLRRLARSLTLGVATNRTTTARSALARFGLLELFAGVVTPIEAKVAKPNPVMMEMALDEMGGLKPSQVVYVGDTSADQGLAKASNVRLIAFRNPELEAWAHVDEFEQISSLLDGA
jgi:phosphoglycolate phosphatase-like HAD superfamily hydrolase